MLVHWSVKSVRRSFRAQNARRLEAENNRGRRPQVPSNPRAHGLPRLEEPTGKETQFGRKSHFFAQIQADSPLKELKVLENRLSVSLTDIWTPGLSSHTAQGPWPFLGGALICMFQATGQLSRPLGQAHR